MIVSSSSVIFSRIVFAFVEQNFENVSRSTSSRKIHAKSGGNRLNVTRIFAESTSDVWYSVTFASKGSTTNSINVEVDDIDAVRS